MTVCTDRKKDECYVQRNNECAFLSHSTQGKVSVHFLYVSLLC